MVQANQAFNKVQAEQPDRFATLMGNTVDSAANGSDPSDNPADKAVSKNRFEPSRSAALKQISKIKPDHYAKTRNFVDGAVTRLSPWLTHGFVTTREAARLVCDRHALSFEDKLIFEFAWREFFHHVHSHLGDDIFKDIRRPVFNGRYQDQLPTDLVEARTGVRAIDEGVRQLYSTGYLHNHVRMWIASYTVHFRKVSWKAGANWMYSHLLDGDLASNHLSWQWVAGTFSHKPYLFNADNVERYARQWPCRGTVIDQSYEDLANMAKSQRDVGPEPTAPEHGVQPDSTISEPPQAFRDQINGLDALQAWTEARQLKGREVRLVHPWDLGSRELDASDRDTVQGGDKCGSEAQSNGSSKASAPRIGLIVRNFHERFKWSARRWEFVMEGMTQCCDLILEIDQAEVSSLKRMFGEWRIRLRGGETQNPAYSEVFKQLCDHLDTEAEGCILPELTMLQQSFSRFYSKACSRAGSLDAALGLQESLDVPKRPFVSL